MTTLYSIELNGVHRFQEVHIRIFLMLVQLPEENYALIFIFLNCGCDLSLAHPSNSPHAVHLSLSQHRREAAALETYFCWTPFVLLGRCVLPLE